MTEMRDFLNLVRKMRLAQGDCATHPGLPYARREKEKSEKAVDAFIRRWQARQAEKAQRELSPGEEPVKKTGLPPGGDGKHFFSDGLTCGIAWAAGILNRYFGTQSAKFILKESGITSKKELRKAGCDEYDITNIGDLLPEEKEDMPHEEI